MKKQIPAFLAGVVTTALVTSLAVPALAAYTKNMTVSYSDIRINVNGTTFTPTDVTGQTVEPFIYSGTTYLPVRAVADAVGYNVAWDQSSKTVYLTNGNNSSAGGGYSGGGGTTTMATKLVDALTPYAGYNYELFPSTGSDSISMGGSTYKNAIALSRSYFNTSYASYNLEGRYTTLGGVIGCMSNSDSGTQTVSIYGDGNLLKTFDITLESLPTTFSVDVTGVSALKFSMPEGPMLNIGIADLKLS